MQMTARLGTLQATCLVVLFFPLSAQSQDDDLRVYTQHPRLFLRAGRLKLLKRERERQSLRWMQMEMLMAGKARMPETGFANALYYRVSGDEATGRIATDWALGPGDDLRQLALVFDWCQELLSPAQRKSLAAKLQRGIEVSEQDHSVRAARSRMLAAVALADHLSQASTRQVERLVRQWWGGRIVPGLKAGRQVVGRDDLYAMFELLHVVRDNLEIDLRESAPAFFKDLTQWQLLSYYPARYPAPENEYRIPAGKGPAEPDLKRAALSRAAELSMVAYDTNAPESQVLQGWLMHDHFLMRSAFGISYELLWANPYQPGLSPYHVPLVFHDGRYGQVFARSSWDDDASWAGYFGGETQVFRDGKPALVRPGAEGEVIAFSDALILVPGGASRFKLAPGEAEDLFVVGLKPSTMYEVEIDREELSEHLTDRGGILWLTVRPNHATGVRFREGRK
jgi:hypothetical protein